MIHGSEYLVQAIQQDRRDEGERERRTRALRVAARGATASGRIVRRRQLAAPARRAGIAT